MRQGRRRFWLLLVLLLWQPRQVCAQESALVPPWGRNLEETSEAAAPSTDEAAAVIHAEEPAQHRWRFLGDYLLMFTKNDRIPPLLTTGPTSDPRPGAVGRQFTRILYGDAIDFEERHGGRFTVVMALGTADEWSLAASYFLLGARDVGPTRASPGSPILARPFFDAVNRREDSSLVSFPGTAIGSIAVDADSFLQGAELNLQHVLRNGERCHVTVFAGLRYLDLDEELSIAESTALAPAAGPLAGRRVSVLDRFEADNDFFGGQVGAGIDLHYKRFTFQVMSKVALGNVRETILVRGRTIIDTTPVTDEPAGLFALATNSGRCSRDSFAVVPEVSAKLGLRISERLTVFGGYTFLYWSDVVRPGEQIDRNLNPNLIPTSASFGGPATPRQPVMAFRTSDYWAQGMIWGFEFRY
ncbi:MAG: BBP7 family outer membrane beta-barrel protein [Gemmataceae bacterium]|nr:BBP7 family outer membrane beta-barrel protein [Gemmataceae bacterium]